MFFVLPLLLGGGGQTCVKRERGREMRCSVRFCSSFGSFPGLTKKGSSISWKRTMITSIDCFGKEADARIQDDADCFGIFIFYRIQGAKISFLKFRGISCLLINN